MNWLEKMNKAMAYIEENLAGEIKYDRIAQVLCCSVFHFQKIFSLMTGTPLSEYIRNRRLSMAAFDLQGKGEKVLDVALKYGYDSPTAFNRAFRRMHGIAPSDARERGAHLKAYPPIAFQLSIKGAVIMDYSIREQKPFRAIGRKLRTSMENEQNLRDIPAFWAEACQNGTMKQLAEICMEEAREGERQRPLGIMGVCVVPKTRDALTFDYYIALASDRPAPAGMEEIEFPGATYAVFECTGPLPDSLQDLTRRIYTEWLPNSGYEFGDAPDIELYADGDTAAADYRSQVWIPVVRKGETI